MDNKEFALQEHEKWAGKIEVISRAKLDTPEDLAVCYTPGVAEPCIKYQRMWIFLINIPVVTTW